MILSFSGSGSAATTLGLAAAVVGNGGDVLDRGDLDAGVLDGADGGVAARARALHLHLGAAQACSWAAFPRTLAASWAANGVDFHEPL